MSLLARCQLEYVDCETNADVTCDQHLCQHLTLVVLVSCCQTNSGLITDGARGGQLAPYALETVSLTTCQ